MTKIRGFETVSSYKNIHLPVRSTTNAAGYDFEAAEDIVLPSMLKQYNHYLLSRDDVFSQSDLTDKLKRDNKNLNEFIAKFVKPTLIHTGVKAYMQPDEYLELVNRSSGAVKRSMLMSNGVGVIDSDYYNNSSNEGEIAFQFLNFGEQDYVVHKGDRIGQGIFKKYLLSDNDKPGKKRTGGFGSTGK